jgi:hypothetical protein
VWHVEADDQYIMQVVSAIFGALKGLVWLNLGVVANFQELRQNFHKGPHQWWRCCISGEGDRNIRRCACTLVLIFRIFKQQAALLCGRAQHHQVLFCIGSI